MSMVVFILLLTTVMQGGITYSLNFGKLDAVSQGLKFFPLASIWIMLRIAMIVAVLTLWTLNQKQELFKAIIFTDGILTVALLANMLALFAVLFGLSTQDIKSLLFNVVLLAISNILIFSIWYWVIDPPGVEENPRTDEPWDFLFPQRANSLPHYEDWLPRYTDYIFLAFTTSFAFSPTDTMPLTPRAKLLMILQSTISIITLTGIAGSAINILAGGSGG
jgi:hypothetical protein